ncbi:quinolinate synthase NadA [Pasteuria penetrans]|uniref:quinolinate synthase NadA n=1 Tax=Pasteuria penetrans TaxID=86005 RepID=UPI000FA441C9|nr:quinolinate synthase NadA [Pasteuria penetrans]
MAIERGNFMVEPLPQIYRQLAGDRLDEGIRRAKFTLGKDLVILGHHYQREDVIVYADHRGDSLLLSKKGARQRTARFLVFCGVHFMAETADILAAPGQQVILPDLRAGCSMADMADIGDLEEAWGILEEVCGRDTILPVTYVNSSAAIKAFVGKHHGLTCTSSNARRVLTWAWERKRKILFLPDLHLGRNTAYAMGVPLERMAIWSPGLGKIIDATVPVEQLQLILWQGYCSVHQKFTLEHVESFRKREPDCKIIVHPECSFEVVQAADYSGSTESIIKTIAAAPAGTRWAVGTEVNLVQRLAKQYPEKKIRLLSTTMCPCLTMNRIDRPHLLWSLDCILAKEPVNRIIVDEVTKHWAKLAIDRMLSLA